MGKMGTTRRYGDQMTDDSRQQGNYSEFWIAEFRIAKSSTRYLLSSVVRLLTYAPCLPNAPDGILHDKLVWGENYQAMHNCLTDKHAVKGIFMHFRKTRQVQGGFLF
jgi:hypothetical protein